MLRWALYEAGKTHARSTAPDHAYYAAVKERIDGKRAAISEAREQRPDYRGQEFVALGLKLARDGYLDAHIIGEAAKSGLYDEQSLKRVWHYVARFGGPATAVD